MVTSDIHIQPRPIRARRVPVCHRRPLQGPTAPSSSRTRLVCVSADEAPYRLSFDLQGVWTEGQTFRSSEVLEELG